MRHTTKENNFTSTFRALWRWVVSYDARERLSFTVDEIVRENHIDPALLSSALDDFASYMKLVYGDQAKEAPAMYARIRAAYPAKVRSLAKCAILLRHGLFKGRLAAHDYDLTSKLCGRITGGAKLRPFLRKIDRIGRGQSEA